MCQCYNTLTESKIDSMRSIGNILKMAIYFLFWLISISVILKIHFVQTHSRLGIFQRYVCLSCRVTSTCKINIKGKRKKERTEKKRLVTYDMRIACVRENIVGDRVEQRFRTRGGFWIVGKRGEWRLWRGRRREIIFRNHAFFRFVSFDLWVEYILCFVNDWKFWNHFWNWKLSVWYRKMF